MFVCSLTAASLLADSPSQMTPFSTDQIGIITKNDCHRGPRGHRGPKGHRGHRGATGPMPVIPPTPMISLTFHSGATGPGVDISPKNGSLPILPCGTPDITPTPFLEYIDPDPSDPTADRYIRVLPGGAGVYLIALSVFAKTSSYMAQDPVILKLQPQVNFGSGWITAIPYNNFQTTFTGASSQSQAFYSSAGASTGLLYLPDNAKIRAAVLAATDLLSVGIPSLDPTLPPSRDVAVLLMQVG